jgi:hypothetical protein
MFTDFSDEHRQTATRLPDLTGKETEIFVAITMKMPNLTGFLRISYLVLFR